MQHKTTRQVTTGLVVNKKVNIKKEYYRNARAMCHSLFLNDEFHINGYLADPLRPGFFKEEKNQGSLRQLEGILSFIYQVKRQAELSKANGRRSNRPEGLTKLYRDFLYYKHFFALEKPLIVCEGKTDVIYLRCALKRLSTMYPGLISEGSDGYKYNVKFLKFSKTLKEVLNIAEGSGLAFFMRNYENQFKMFKGTGKTHPVIVLSDNDSGADTIRKNFKDKIKIGQLSAHIVENLHIVFVPLGGKKEAAIEDLFDTKTLQTEVRGKKFNKTNTNDTKTEYGEKIFAKDVVQANQKSIDFNGFKELLDQFVSIIP